MPTFDIWGSATESRALFSREKCLRPRKYHFSAVRNARDWGNTIFQPWKMPASESPAHFSRSERWKSSHAQDFKEQKFKSLWCRATLPCSFQQTWRRVIKLGWRTLCIKNADRDFKSVMIDPCTCFPNSNNTKSKQQEAALNPKRGNSYEYKKREFPKRLLKKLSLLKKNGGYLLSHGCAVPSARAGLTALFGMGRGGTPPL